MQASEIVAEIKAFAAEIGPKADISVFITSSTYSAGLPSCYVYPQGPGKDGFSGTGETFEEAIADARAKWNKNADSFTAQLIQKMALAIITITATTGDCTDAALRVHGIEQSDIDRHGDAATERANEMAATGPFTIRRLSRANAA